MAVFCQPLKEMTNVSINIFKSIDRVYLLSSIHGSVLITCIDVIDPKSQKEPQEQEVQTEEKEARRSGQRGVGVSEGRGKEIEDEIW